MRRGDSHPPDLGLLGAGVAVFLLVSAVHLVNDLLDRPADRINRPGRPLVRGDLRAGTARQAAIILGAGGLLVGLTAQTGWWVWWLLWFGCGCGYSLVAKGSGWWGPFCTAAVIASLYVPGAGRDGWQLTDTGILVLAVYFLLFREFIKNLEDARGDGAAGYRSLAGGWWDTRSRRVLLVLPLVLAVVGVGWISTVNLWGRLAAVVFSASMLTAVTLLPHSRKHCHHLCGSILKVGALSGLAQLWALPLETLA
jgi:4-hydroxybenzoate polyprenyltransferase